MRGTDTDTYGIERGWRPMVEIIFALKVIALGVGLIALFGAAVVVYILAKASSIEDKYKRDAERKAEQDWYDRLP